MNSALANLHDNVKQLRLGFNKLRQDVLLKLNEYNDSIQATERLCCEVIKMHTELRKPMAALRKGVVILNVGGEKYTTSIETLTQEKNTFFTLLFSRRWELEQDPEDKSIFIDRNGKMFSYILDYLRSNVIPTNMIKDETFLQSLLIEAHYFRLHKLIHAITESLRIRHKVEKEDEERLATEKSIVNGALLQPDHKAKLNEFCGKANQKWELIYKATRDGFSASAFHTHCNNKGPTMTIIRSNNNCIFGGYTVVPWTSNSQCKADRTAFLFTLINPHNIPPTKYIIRSDRAAYAVYHNNSYGAIFGGGYDIHVSDNSNKNNSSSTDFPHSYIDTTGKGNNTFTGAKNFTTFEVEVYKVG
ncbi:unnamed protein product [Adineta steineri]|uniref:TLDc domain-containing protein n=1 Tax=Adineta steineri TaxID=433720 RepID=A0A818ZK46_9BILA|nr:unnamed protein product [Adineta steineri]CAF3773238.1 unnamed protein product [Adineta steineri]